MTMKIMYESDRFYQNVENAEIVKNIVNDWLKYKINQFCDHYGIEDRPETFPHNGRQNRIGYPTKRMYCRTDDGTDKDFWKIELTHHDYYNEDVFWRVEFYLHTDRDRNEFWISTVLYCGSNKDALPKFEKSCPRFIKEFNKNQVLKNARLG